MIDGVRIGTLALLLVEGDGKGSGCVSSRLRLQRQRRRRQSFVLNRPSAIDQDGTATLVLHPSTKLDDCTAFAVQCCSDHSGPNDAAQSYPA